MDTLQKIMDLLHKSEDRHLGKDGLIALRLQLYGDGSGSITAVYFSGEKIDWIEFDAPDDQHLLEPLAALAEGKPHEAIISGGIFEE